jgi:hypothetical protein
METFPRSGTTSRERLTDTGLLFLLVVSFWIASAQSLRLGVLNNEGYWYLPYYLSDRPLLAKLFDSRYTEVGLYQARELSYLFDWLDSVFIAACVHVGVPHFLSVTYFVFSLLIVVSLWRFGRRQLGLDRAVLWLLLAMYLSGPHALLSGSYSRTAKIGVALALVRAVLVVHRALSRPRAPVAGRSLWEGLTLAAWCVVACGFDRQGVFLTACLAIVLGVWSLGRGDTRACVLLSAPAGALMVAALYNRTVAPALTWHLNGYWPDFSYQHLPLSDLYADPLYYLREGGLLVLDILRFTYGHLTPPPGGHHDPWGGPHLGGKGAYDRPVAHRYGHSWHRGRFAGGHARPHGTPPPRCGKTRPAAALLRLGDVCDRRDRDGIRPARHHRAVATEAPGPPMGPGDLRGVQYRCDAPAPGVFSPGLDALEHHAFAAAHCGLAHPVAGRCGGRADGGIRRDLSVLPRASRRPCL